MKKVLLMCTACVLVAALAIGGTIAYLQDDDSDVNVMTLGNVKIEQHEYERVVNEDGSYKTDTIDNRTSYVLQDFTQAKPLLPSAINTTTWEGWGWDEAATVRMTQVDSYGGMDVFKSASNAQDKFVTVENTGKTDAYVRTLVAIECGSTDGSLLNSSYHQTWTVNNIGIISVDGNNYYLQEYVYNGAQLSDGSWRHENGILPAGDTSYPSLAQVYIHSKATNEDMEALDGNDNGALDILVLSQAVQAAGFENAQAALDAAFGTSAEKGAEWFDGIANYEFVGAKTAKYQLAGEAAADALAALQNGTDLLVDPDMDIIAFDTNEVDAKGATVSLNGVGADAYGYLAFLPDAGENVTVSNLNVTGSGFVEVGHYGQGNGTYVLNNVKIENLKSTLANGDKGFTLASAFMHYGNATLNECVMTGAAALTEGAIPVDLACANGFTTVVNGGEYDTVYNWSHAYTTINGAEVDTMYVAPIKGSVTVKAGSHIGTIIIDYGTSAKYATDANIAKLVIEEGASVDAIVYNGTTYTLAQWNAR